MTSRDNKQAAKHIILDKGHKNSSLTTKLVYSVARLILFLSFHIRKRPKNVIRLVYTHKNVWEIDNLTAAGIFDYPAGYPVHH